jgi:hypothetical protein
VLAVVSHQGGQLKAGAACQVFTQVVVHGGQVQFLAHQLQGALNVLPAHPQLPAQLQHHHVRPLLQHTLRRLWEGRQGAQCKGIRSALSRGNLGVQNVPASC